tara:strand:- start:5585 stop:6328 length:744 start_codon:yes stop_codon:yes gene_type:complete
MSKQDKGMPFQKCFIDADSIIYRIAVTSDSVAQAKKYYDKAIEDIVWDTASDEGLVAVKGVGNFRYQVADDYKGQRGNTKVDPDITKIRKAVTKYAWSLGHHKSDNCEADDIVSIWAQEAMEAGVHYVIAHIDKDIDMVEGWHYNFTKKKLYYIDEHEGYYKMCIQMLTGDATDHIQGLKGIGPKKAEKLLADVPTGKLLDVVREAWKDKHPEDWHDRLEVCWNLLYMRRTWDGFRRMKLEEVFGDE